jgi:hypothetical protein
MQLLALKKTHSEILILIFCKKFIDNFSLLIHRKM